MIIMASKKGKIICITSMKGGVGKTTLTTQLALIYKNLGKKVIILDMDLFTGSIALNLGLKDAKTIYNTVDDLSNNRFEDISSYVVNYQENIDCLVSPKDPRQALKIDGKYLEIILNTVSYRYDVILIDTTHGLSRNSLILMDNANLLLYLLTNDAQDMKSSKSFLSILKDIEKDNVKVVLNEAVAPDKKYFSNFDIRNVIKHNIDYTIPKDLYIKNIDQLVMDKVYHRLGEAEIYKSKKSFEHLVTMAKEIIEEE